jgi:hypothetical protein
MYKDEKWKLEPNNESTLFLNDEKSGRVKNINGCSKSKLIG